MEVPPHTSAWSWCVVLHATLPAFGDQLAGHENAEHIKSGAGVCGAGVGGDGVGGALVTSGHHLNCTVMNVPRSSHVTVCGITLAYAFMSNVQVFSLSSSSPFE